MKTIFNLTPKDIENSAKWEYNSFFLETIIPALDYMINEGHGHPATMTSKEWNKILREMRDGFILLEKSVRRISWSFRKEFNKKDKAKIDKSFDLFKEHFLNL